MSDEKDKADPIKNAACGILKAGRENLEKFPPAVLAGADKAVGRIEKELGCDKDKPGKD